MAETPRKYTGSSGVRRIHEVPMSVTALWTNCASAERSRRDPGTNFLSRAGAHGSHHRERRTARAHETKYEHVRMIAAHASRARTPRFGVIHARTNSAKSPLPSTHVFPQPRHRRSCAGTSSWCTCSSVQPRRQYARRYSRKATCTSKEPHRQHVGLSISILSAGPAPHAQR